MVGGDGPIDRLASARYALLTSYRRDGTPVGTPVWIVRDDSALAVWSARDAFKVRRIRRNPAVTLAPCTFRGRPLGPATPGVAEIMDAAGARRVRGLIRRKYRVTGPISVALSVLRRGADGSVGILIRLAHT